MAGSGISTTSCRTAADADAAPAVLGCGRKSGRSRVPPPGGSTSSSISTRRRRRLPSASRIYRRRARGARRGFRADQIAVARQLYIAKDKSDKEAALEKQRQYTQRTINVVARFPDGKTGSHVLAYADKAGATEENAMFGTPDEIAAMLEAVRGAGVRYVLLTIAGGADQMRRFAREIMPAFASAPSARAAE